jgi:cell wall-associated NlpC family hydrolase
MSTPLSLKEKPPAVDAPGMRRLVVLGVAAACALALPVAGLASPRAAAWDQQQIVLVTSHGLLGGDAANFRPNDPLTAGDLADLVTGLTDRPSAPPADPSASVTIAQLDASLVRGEGLQAAAARFRAAAVAAGLQPPARFGPEVVARLLGLRTDHPRPQESLEPAPSSVASRAEAAYSAAKILAWQGWEVQSVTSLSATFALPLVSGWRQTILQQAVALIGYPYVFAGTSERPQTVLGQKVPGGFDCSGFVWRVYKLARYAAGTPLADTLKGRTTYAMSGEVPAAKRIGFAALQPGDVLFFGSNGPRSQPAQVYHAGIYLGGGWMIHSSGTGVSLAPIATGYYAKSFAWARRPLAEAGLG